MSQHIEIHCFEPKILQPTIHECRYVDQKDDELINNTLKKLPRFKKVEIIFEVVALVLLIFGWGYFMKIFATLPNQVPTEFNYEGEVVRYADKNILLVLPGVETLIYIMITVLQLVPHRFNYDCIGISFVNAQQIYRLTRMSLLYNKIITELLFSYITFTLLEVVQYQYRTFVMYFAFGFLIPYTLGGIVYYRSLRKLHLNQTI